MRKSKCHQSWVPGALGAACFVANAAAFAQEPPAGSAAEAPGLREVYVIALEEL